MKTLVLACEVMKEELLRVPRRTEVELAFIPMGLHAVPKRLNVTLRERLASTREYDRVVLGFGLCGNATAGLVSPHARLTLPRVHDCIALLLGEPKHRETPLDRGVFYLSGGWMEGERTIPAEHRRTIERFGQKKALRVLQIMFASYHSLRFIRTDHPRRVGLELETRSLGQLLNLPVDCCDGNRDFLEHLVNGPWNGDEFITVDPGVAIDPCYAIRRSTVKMAEQ